MVSKTAQTGAPAYAFWYTILDESASMGIDFKPNLQELLQKELTRKQFIQVVGVMVVSLLGFNNLINMLTHLNRPADSKQTQARNGFGSNKFGA